MKLVFGNLVIGVGDICRRELGPGLYANYSFSDAMKTEATLQTYTTKPESEKFRTPSTRRHETSAFRR